jgi:hypothetical protein
MIGSVLETAQKLVGRGFVLAAFIPTLLFAAIYQYLFGGIDSLRTIVQNWVEENWTATAFQITLLLVAVYLMAYVLYGLRTAFYEFYRGAWPRPLRGLHEWFRAREKRAMGHSETDVEAKLGPLNVHLWATKKCFENAYDRTTVDEAQAQKSLETARKAYTSLGEVREGYSSEKTYWQILIQLHRLQANAAGFSSGFQASLENMIQRVREDYQCNQTLQKAVENLRAYALGEWSVAYGYHTSTFPENPRWLAPTRLGNVLSTLETYTLNRYGIGFSELWPRLALVMSSEARLRIEEANIYLDFVLVMGLLSLVTVPASIAAAFYGPPRALAVQVGLPLVFLFMAVLFNQLAVQAARSYNVQVHSAVDLYRLKLLDALNIQAPKTAAEEQKIWMEIRYFIEQADLPRKHAILKTAGEHARKNALFE